MKRNFYKAFHELLKICLKNNIDNITIAENGEIINLKKQLNGNLNVNDAILKIENLMNELMTQIGCNLTVFYSIISEILENYSVIPNEGKICVGKERANLEELYLIDDAMSLELKTTDHKTFPTRNDMIYINYLNTESDEEKITSYQETLGNNYIIITTSYDPKEEHSTIRKKIEVYDEKATLDILNNRTKNNLYKPDLTREIEVIKIELNTYIINDYEILDNNKKILLDSYKLESDRDINKIASLYVKQLELEKLVERPIDFKKYRITKQKKY